MTIYTDENNKDLLEVFEELNITIRDYASEASMDVDEIRDSLMRRMYGVEFMEGINAY